MPSLKIILKQANNLPAKDSTGTSDPLVVCTLNGKSVFKTEPIMMTLNPVWDGNTKIKHEFTIELKDIYHDQLILEVMDYNIFTKNKPIGSTVIPLTLLERKPQIVTYCLSDSKFNGPAGTITVLLEPLDFGISHSLSGNNLNGMVQQQPQQPQQQQQIVNTTTIPQQQQQHPLQKSSAMNQSFHNSPQGFVPQPNTNQQQASYNNMRSQSVIGNTSPHLNNNQPLQPQMQQNVTPPTFNGNNQATMGVMNPSYGSTSPNAFSQQQPLPQQNQGLYNRTQSFIQPNASLYTGGSPSTSFNSVSVHSTKRDPKPLPTLPPKSSTDPSVTSIESKRPPFNSFNGVVDDAYIDYVISQCPIPSPPFYSKSFN
ncbi:hypothetical protein C9374_013555 [Naegleria lovaniensis]|uniref:C2 domain-containing protein n=1 Tax=Naegleria lovaniensis TaxID=51637 RepID=A0AA88GZI7_NAELO|nr:uncharacterized protein C9374_013555 [Naegleria lovaniensis]KAG2392070.1 hypothetical protein C9374_013555 [Naegleria lovaniensis]